jgi:hypothetical protein
MRVQLAPMEIKYKYAYARLITAGHSHFKAVEIIIDAGRGSRYALDWIKVVCGRSVGKHSKF